MFVKSVRHVARSASNAPALPCLAVRTPTPPITACQKHQRRQSSSKPSSTSGGSRGAEQAARDPSDAPVEGERRPAGRLTRRKSKEAATVPALKAKDDGFVNVPAVPPTNHLNPQDVAISTFFSLHRPISVTTPIPPTTSISSFNSIFDPPKPIKATDVIFTLSNAVSILENGVDHLNGPSINKAFLREIIQEASSNTEPNRRSAIVMTPEQYAHQMQKLAQMFRPFNVPPEPRPFTDNHPQKDEKSKMSSRQKADGTARRRPRAKTSASKLQVDGLDSSELEMSTQDEAQSHTKTRQHYGHQRLQATHSERKNVHTKQSVPSTGTHLHTLPKPMARVSESSLPGRPKGKACITGSGPRKMNARSMFLISVKRQRKLKMKKHKYKKLMRRTRTIRKRDGRL